jgi:hypothetical protein
MKKLLQKSILLILFPLLCLVQRSFAEETNKALLPTVTLSTEAVASASVVQGTSGNVYVVKVLSTEAFVLNNISFKMSGTYSASDLNAIYLYKGTTNNIASATFTGSSAAIGSGGTTTFNIGTNNIAANTATYFFLQVVVKNTAIVGRTIKVNGADSPNPVTLTSTASTLTIVNNQTDITGPQTITAPTLTYSSEPLPAYNAIIGASSQLVYAMKIVNDFAVNNINQIQVKLAGTFLAGDVTSVVVSLSNTPNISGIGSYTYPQSATTLANGSIVTITNPFPVWSLSANSTIYFLVTVNLSSTAVAGRTVKIDGSNNPVTFISTSSTPAIVNNQTDVAGPLTITTPEITLSTEPVAAAFISPNSSGILYALKVLSITGAVLKGLNIPIQGTFTNSDVSSWSVFIASSPTATSGTPLGGSYTFSSGVLSNSPSGLGLYNLPANTPTYIIVRPFFPSTAVNGRTLKVNGATNPATVIANGTPLLTNNQTDLAGTQTIQGPIIGITTVAKASNNVAPINALTEIYNIKAISDKVTKIEQISFKVGGTFTAGKISQIYVYESTNNTAGSPILILSTPTNTSGDIITFPIGASYGFLTANTAKYYKFFALCSTTLPDGYNIKVDGSNNMLSVLTSTTYPQTSIVDNQTDVFGTQGFIGDLPPALTTSGSISTIIPTEKTAYFATLRYQIIATLKADPQISGTTNCTVYPSGGQALNCVRRHFEINVPGVSAANLATITLYFAQSDFDYYNTTASVDLPTSNADATGKSNLRIKKFSGTSTSNGTVYTGGSTEIDPDDSKIIFQNDRWEVTFDVANFSGFFVNTPPPPCPGTGISPSSAILTCSAPTASIIATGGGTYSWTGPSGFTSANATISASVAGSYIVTAVTTNNCTAILTVTVTENKATPTITITPTSAILTCTTPTTNITASGGSTYAWTGPSGFTSATASISASLAGSYIVTVTGANGCTSTASVSVTNNNTPPSVSVSPTSAILICGTPTASLTASGGGTYAWTGPSGFTSSLAIITANTGGSYVVKVTGANGCTATTSVMVTDNIAPVAPTISPSGTTTLCPPATSLTLTASGCVGGTITWNTSPTQSTGTSITVTQAGSFSATCTTACGTSLASATTVVSTVCICLLNITLGSDIWSNANNWSCGHIPLVTEPVQISSGHTITLDVNGTAKSLDLRGVLNKQATKVLTIQGN